MKNTHTHTQQKQNNNFGVFLDHTNHSLIPTLSLTLPPSLTHYPLTHPPSSLPPTLSPFHPLCHPPTQSLTHPLTHYLTHSLTHPLTHSPSLPPFHPLTQSLPPCSSSNRQLCFTHSCLLFGIMGIVLVMHLP